MTGEPSLDALYLQVGDRVRFRKSSTGRWNEALVEGLSRDGSVAVRDGKGATRSIPAGRLEVKVKTKRGLFQWQPVVGRAERSAQRPLFEP